MEPFATTFWIGTGLFAVGVMTFAIPAIDPKTTSSVGLAIGTVGVVTMVVTVILYAIAAGVSDLPAYNQGYSGAPFPALPGPETVYHHRDKFGTPIP